MAKGGVNLNPGADSTIVSAAYRAAMANKPADLSKTFGRIATGYAKTMDIFGKQGAALGKQVGVLAAPLVEKAVKDISFYGFKQLPKGMDEKIRPYIFGDEEAGITGIVPSMKANKKELRSLQKDTEEYTKLSAKIEKQKAELISFRNSATSAIKLQLGKIGDPSGGLAGGDANNPNDIFGFTVVSNLGKPLTAKDLGDNPANKDLIGAYAVPEFNENNEIVMGLYKDGKKISGLSADNKIQYVDKSDLKDQAVKFTVKDNVPEVLLADKPDKTQTQEIQQALVTAGYDIGPDGADGKWDRKDGKKSNTQKAWEKFKIDLKAEKTQTARMAEERTHYQFDIEGMSSMFTYKDNALGVSLNTLSDDVKKDAGKGIVFDGDDIKVDLLGTIKTSSQLKYLQNERLRGTETTFSKHMSGINQETATAYLNTNPSILNHLQDITGPSGMPDGEITELDIQGQEGFTNTINAMKKDKEFFVDWYVGKLEDTHAKFFREKGSGKSGKSGGGGLTYQMPGIDGGGAQYVNKTLIDPQVKLLNEDPYTIKKQDSWNGITWKKDKGIYSTWVKDEEHAKGGTWEPLTKDQLVGNLMFNKNHGYTGTASVGGGDSRKVNQEMFKKNQLKGQTGPKNTERPWQEGDIFTNPKGTQYKYTLVDGKLEWHAVKKKSLD